MIVGLEAPQLMFGSIVDTRGVVDQFAPPTFPVQPHFAFD